MSVLFWLFFLFCLCFLIQQSCTCSPSGSPVLAVLSWRFSNGSLVLSFLFRLSSPFCPLLAVLSGLFCVAVLPWLSCSGCPAWLSYPDCLIMAALSWQPCSAGLVPPVQFCLSGSARPFLVVLSFRSCPGLYPGSPACPGEACFSSLVWQSFLASCSASPVLPVLAANLVQPFMFCLSYSACLVLPV
jgi:hypothetical protein